MISDNMQQTAKPRHTLSFNHLELAHPSRHYRGLSDTSTGPFGCWDMIADRQYG